MLTKEASAGAASPPQILRSLSSTIGRMAFCYPGRCSHYTRTATLWKQMSWPVSGGLSPPDQAQYATPLVEAGYTVFAISHRALPRFRYPAAVEDAQRAVRYVRFHAERYGIRADRIGAAGGSSGGHLVSLLGVLDGTGEPDDADAVNRESAKVQCVVARAAPIDFINAMVTFAGSTPGLGFVGMNVRRGAELYPPTSIEYKTYRAASPLYHVTKDAPPFLLIHGDADETVPFRNSELMQEALEQAGVAVKLLPIPRGGHGPVFPGATNPPDYLGEMVRWFDQHLRAGQPAVAPAAKVSSGV